MCLWIKNNKMRVASKDIVCYKTLSLTDCGSYETSYLGTRVPESVIDGSEPFVARGNILVKARSNYVKVKEKDVKYNYVTSGGLIHTFAKLKDPRKVNKDFGFYDTIFKCVIPKGTKYYVGLFDGDYKSYASERIMFVEKVYDPIINETKNDEKN